MRDEYPEIFDSFRESRVHLSVCPEAEHINVIALKLSSILARVNLEEVVVLTVDGSPHCVQLHHAIEEAARVTGNRVVVHHYVIEEGKAVQVSREAVKVARYLSRVDKLLSGRSRKE